MNKDDPRLELLFEVGRCLHIWSVVEIEIANLFMVLQRIQLNDFTHPNRAAFDVVKSLDVKLAMLEAYVAADNYALENYLPHLKRLKGRIFELYKKRHEVAHFAVTSESSSNDPVIRPFFTWMNYAQKKGTELSAKQIAERAKSFEELAFIIMRHTQHVGRLRKLPLEHFAQEGDRAFPPLGEEDLTPITQKQRR